jgi:hypothetical protein
MRIEGEDCLRPGSMLFRFVQRADVSDREYVSSPWWFQISAVRKILQAARSGHRGSDKADEQVSRMAALSQTWDRSGANYLLAAKVTAPIIFYWGAPKPVGKRRAEQGLASGLSNGESVTQIEIVPDPRCVQFYVPGMKKKELARKAFRVSSRTKFTHSVDLAKGEIEVFLKRIGA